MRKRRQRKLGATKGTFVLGHVQVSHAYRFYGLRI